MNTFDNPPLETPDEKHITTEEIPKRNVLLLIWKSIYDWRELWFWPLIALIQWRTLIWIATVASGRKPEESLDFLVGLGSNILVCVLAISLLSILRESNGTWWTKEQLMQYPHLSYASAIIKTVLGVAFLWALKH